MIVSKAFVHATYRRKLMELAALGVNVVAITPPRWTEGGAPQPLEPGEDGPYELVVTPLVWNGHYHLHFYPALSRLIRRHRPDVLHVDEEPYNLATYLAVRSARRKGVPALFFTWQNILRRYPPPFSRMEVSVYRTAAHGLAGSEGAARVLRAKGFGGPLTVVPQFGVDPDLFAPTSRRERPFTVGFLNRLVPEKAPLLALQAFARLPNDSRLVVAGDGPLHQSLAEGVARLGVASRVEMLPRVPSARVPEIMHRLDVVLLPSLTLARWKEQFGRVLIEAMASGLPVIGSDSGEIPNVIGNAGIVVPEGDADALAAALQRLHDDDNLRCALGQNGRERAVRVYSQRRIAETTLDAYRQVLSTRPRRS